MKSKQEIREEVWRRLEKVAKFPPPWGRIPNFVGAEKACEKLRELKEYERANVVFVAPDSPLYRAREIVLEDGKILVSPKPRFTGVVVIDKKIKPTIANMMKFGKDVNEEMLRKMVEKVDVFVQGCVAVDLNGNRIGKGTGYGDREYWFLKEAGLIDSTLYVVICHELQIYEDFSHLAEEHDVRCDVILTPERILWTKGAPKRGR